MTKKEIILNKLYNIYNKISQNSKYTLALKNTLWFLILDIKNTNKAEFIQDDVFYLLKNEFNIKSKGIGYILDLKNN
ncbi:MAG: hypothetical protein SO148_05100 [Candidatus Onthovivens sp.]|nr:hypothetical protein [Candidatus Onthovivens sp.]